MAKKVTLYEVRVSNLDNRDPDRFIATKMKIATNGTVECEGSYRRKKAIISIIFPLANVVSIEEYQEEVEAAGKEDKGEEKV